MVVVAFFLLLTGITGCTQEEKPAPESNITIMEYEIEDVFFTAKDSAEGGFYQDLSVIFGTTVLQLYCGEEVLTYSSATMMGNLWINSDDCPELSEGVYMQMVETSQEMDLGCVSCEASYNFDVEIGAGFAATRGFIKLTADSPFLLMATPKDYVEESLTE